MIGIGVDIERVERFAHFKSDGQDPFLQRVFIPNELAYCFSSANPAEHLAGRYAAKEAVIKALGNFSSEAIAYTDIEIQRNEKGAPVVRCVRSDIASLNIQVSISHTNETAIAFAVITNYE